MGKGKIVADFYVGRGKGATYLGSLWGDVSPEDLRAFTRFQGSDTRLYDVHRFRADVAELVESGRFEWSENGTRWPHPYASSAFSTWTYCYDAASVHVYQDGFQVATILCNGARKEAEFPRFTPSARKD